MPGIWLLLSLIGCSEYDIKSREDGEGGARPDVAVDPLSVNFGESVDLGTELPAVLTAGSPGAARPTSIDVTTDAGTARTDFAATDDPVVLAVPPGPTTTLRLTMRAAESGRNDTGFGIAELTLPDGPVARSVLPLGESEVDGWLFQATPGSRGGCVMNGERISCSADQGWEDEGRTTPCAWRRLERGS